MTSNRLKEADFRPLTGCGTAVFVRCKSRSTAKRNLPWAERVAKCDGGFIAFESASDWRRWKKEQIR